MKLTTPERNRLPDERPGKTHNVTIAGTDIVINTGEYEDGRCGEVFIELKKQGDHMRVYDSVAIAISIALQYGVPLDVFVQKFKHQKLEPSGVTSNEKIPIADSIVDYVAKWLELKYLGEGHDNK
ncbi:MAG: hypothetical protein GY854_19735 [Deltaproteobacteria bacterium]|nr:hypothetical protein [Deltaproteobacteria bacterium]